MDQQPCGCSRPRYKIAFSCSGAADVGALADEAVRRLARERLASMCCVAAIAAGIQDILETARNAASVLAIDGCSKDCSSVVLRNAGITDFRHLQLESLGFSKGESPPTAERCERVLMSARRLLAD